MSDQSSKKENPSEDTLRKRVSGGPSSRRENRSSFPDTSQYHLEAIILPSDGRLTDPGSADEEQASRPLSPEPHGDSERTLDSETHGRSDNSPLSESRAHYSSVPGKPTLSPPPPPGRGPLAAGVPPRPNGGPPPVMPPPSKPIVTRATSVEEEARPLPSTDIAATQSTAASPQKRGSSLAHLMRKEPPSVVPQNGDATHQLLDGGLELDSRLPEHSAFELEPVRIPDSATDLEPASATQVSEPFSTDDYLSDSLEESFTNSHSEDSWSETAAIQDNELPSSTPSSSFGATVAFDESQSSSDLEWSEDFQGVDEGQSEDSNWYQGEQEYQSSGDAYEGEGYTEYAGHSFGSFEESSYGESYSESYGEDGGEYSEHDGRWSEDNQAYDDASETDPKTDSETGYETYYQNSEEDVAPAGDVSLSNEAQHQNWYQEDVHSHQAEEAVEGFSDNHEISTDSDEFLRWDETDKTVEPESLSDWALSEEVEDIDQLDSVESIVALGAEDNYSAITDSFSELPLEDEFVVTDTSESSLRVGGRSQNDGAELEVAFESEQELVETSDEHDVELESESEPRQMDSILEPELLLDGGLELDSVLPEHSAFELEPVSIDRDADDVKSEIETEEGSNLLLDGGLELDTQLPEQSAFELQPVEIEKVETDREDTEAPELLLDGGLELDSRLPDESAYEIETMHLPGQIREPRRSSDSSTPSPVPPMLSPPSMISSLENPFETHLPSSNLLEGGLELDSALPEESMYELDTMHLPGQIRPPVSASGTFSTRTEDPTPNSSGLLEGGLELDFLTPDQSFYEMAPIDFAEDFQTRASRSQENESPSSGLLEGGLELDFRMPDESIYELDPVVLPGSVGDRPRRNTTDGDTRSREVAPPNQTSNRGGSPSKSANDPRLGVVLSEKYLITDVTGAGATAIVYKARQLATDRIVAIKALKDFSSHIVSSFEQEMVTHSRLEHRNIVEFIEKLTEPDGTVFLVMEHIKGTSLQDLIRRGPIKSEETVWTIMSQICDALEHAHRRGVIHRDLKTGNIVLAKQDESDFLVKVLDFGLSIREWVSQTTNRETTAGSPLYMSPEQCRGRELTPRSDLYSVGIIMYEIICGTPPFVGGSYRDIMAAHCNPLIKPEPLSKRSPDLAGVGQLDQIIGKLLRTAEGERFLNASKLKAALEFWIESVRSGETDRPIPEEDFATASSFCNESLGELVRQSQTTIYKQGLAEKAEKSEAEKQRLRKRSAIRQIVLLSLLLIVLGGIAAFYFLH